MAARGVVPMVEKEGESDGLERLCRGRRLMDQILLEHEESF
jgi:hypothetical protein